MDTTKIVVGSSDSGQVMLVHGLLDLLPGGRR